MSTTGSISRRTIIAALAGMGGTTLLSPRSAVATADPQDPRVSRIISENITIDMHNHIGQPIFSAYDKRPSESRANADDIDLVGEMRRAGLTAACLTSFVDLYLTPQADDWYRYHLEIFDYIDRVIEMNKIRRALTSADLRAAHVSKFPTIVQSSEGVQWIGGDLRRVAEAYRRGLRHLQLFHQRHDTHQPLGGIQQLIPSGAMHPTPSAEPTGITPFGLEVVEECNKLGILVDLAHASEQSVLDVVKTSHHPLLCSHTALDTPNARSADIYTANPGLRSRLVSTAYARAVAETGGIMGVWRIFPTLKAYVLGIKEMVDVVGVDHTGIGTDTVIAPPPSNSAISARQPRTNAIWPDQRAGFVYALIEEMLVQGFTEADIGKIVGGNYVRVFGEITKNGVVSAV